MDKLSHLEFEVEDIKKSLFGSKKAGGAVGKNAQTDTGGAVGKNANSRNGFAGGENSSATANGAVQLGEGTNNNANTLQFGNYPLVDDSGKIPNDRLSLDNSPISQSTNPVTSGGVFEAIQNDKVFFTTYAFPNNANSFRFQICEAGDFDKYDYEFIIHSNSITTATSAYLRFGTSSSDLDTDGGNSRIHAYWTNNNESNGTLSSYQTGAGNYSLYYNRSANKTFWGNMKIESRSDAACWTALLGRTRTGDIEYRIGFNSIPAASVTHARIYLASGNFSGTSGTLTVYRRKKVF